MGSGEAGGGKQGGAVRVKVPACVYVVFHPDSPEGPELARSIFRWLRLKEGDVATTEEGIPVYYRVKLEEGRDFRDIAWTEAERNFVVPLIDDVFAADGAYVEALERLIGVDRSPVEQKQGLVLLPVYVSTAFDAIRSLADPAQPIRIYDRGDPEVPRHPPQKHDVAPTPRWAAPTELRLGEKKQLTAKDLDEDQMRRWRDAWNTRMQLRARRLRRKLTEALVRHLRVHTGAAQERLRVFISHAKADGEPIALRIRDELASLGQILPWFDANDLPPGERPFERMSGAAGSTTDGMIAVVTDAYATRPWCYHESIEARRPRIYPESPVVRVQPVVAVHVPGARWSRLPGQLAQVPRIGWPGPVRFPPVSEAMRTADPLGVQEEERRRAEARARVAEEERTRVADVVDALLREMLLQANAYRLATLVSELPSTTATGEPSKLFLGFPPDIWTLMRIPGALAKAERVREASARIVYPGYSLRRVEREELADAARASGVGTELVTLEAARQTPRRPFDAPIHPLVGVSAGGAAHELWRSDVGMEQVDDLLVVISRSLIERGVTVAYGGNLSAEHGNNLTEALLAVAEGWRADDAFDLTPPTANEEVVQAPPPVVNYAAWPNPALISDARVGRLLHTCQFIGVDPDGTTTGRPNGVSRPGSRPGWHATPSPQDRAYWVKDAGWRKAEPLHGAVALSKMRERMAKDCQLRVLFAGKIHGASGFLPGIAEELWESVRQTRPFLIFGALGGCAGLLADFLGETPCPWPEELTFEGELEARTTFAVGAGAWLKDGLTEGEVRQRYAALKAELTRFRAGLPPRKKDKPEEEKAVNGVPRHLWEEALITRSPTRIVQIVHEALDSVVAAAPVAGTGT